jgi:hypothetical protein
VIDGVRVEVGDAGNIASPHEDVELSSQMAKAMPRVLMGRKGLTVPTFTGPFHACISEGSGYRPIGHPLSEGLPMSDAW